MLIVFLPGLGGSVIVDARGKAVYPSKKIKELASAELDERAWNRLAEGARAGGPVLKIYTVPVYSKFFNYFAARGVKTLSLDRLVHRDKAFDPAKMYLVGVGWNWLESHAGEEIRNTLHSIATAWRQWAGNAPIVAVGHSSGALVALHHNGLYPHTFDTIIGVDAPFNGTVEAGRLLTLGDASFHPPGMSTAQWWRLAQKPSCRVVHELLTQRDLEQFANSEYSGLDQNKIGSALSFRFLCDHSPSAVIALIPWNTQFTYDELLMYPQQRVSMRVERVHTSKKHAVLLTSNKVLKYIHGLLLEMMEKK